MTFLAALSLGVFMTYIPEYLDISTLTSPKLVALYTLWTSSRSDFQGLLTEKSGFLGQMRDDLTIVDVIGMPPQYLFSFVGRNVIQHFGDDPTGTRLDRSSNVTVRLLMQKAFDSIVQNRKPVCGQRNDLIGHLLLRYEVVILPISVVDGGPISRMVIAFDFSRKEERRFRSVSSHYLEDPASIKSATLGRLYKHYCDSKPADTLPNAKHFNRAQLKAAYDDIVELSVCYNPLKFQIDFVGTNIISMLGHDPTNRDVEKIEDSELGQLYFVTFKSTIDKRKPMRLQLQRPIAQEWVDIEIIILPIGNDAGEIIQIIAGAIFSKRQILT